jgi:hypothetical protein
MILAELEVFHSRPVAPTRRVALGAVHLPMDPPPGHGATLLAAIAAAHAPAIDGESADEYRRLLRQIDRGQRIAQPRLRYQEDRVGLTRSVHRLVADGSKLRFRLERASGSAEQHLLAVAYACAPMPDAARRAAVTAVEVGMQWRGALDARFVSRVLGRSTTASMPVLALSDPEGWARRVLAGNAALLLVTDAQGPLSKTVVQRRFREQLRDAHPDHGGEREGAAERIADLTEARRILLA